MAMNFDRFFSYSATAQMVLDPYQDRVVFANQEACRLLLMDTAALQQKRISDLFAASFTSLIVFTQEVINYGRGWNDQLLLLINGDELRIEVTGRYSEAGDERLLHFSIQQVDVIDQLRKHSDANQYYLSGIGHWNRVTKVFQEFEHENRLLLDAAGEGIYGLDANGITTFVNPAAERILGYTSVELAGRNMHSTVHHSHADGSHFDKTACPIFTAFKEGTVQQVKDDVFWSKAGEPIDVEYTSTPIYDHGNIVGAVVIFRDVSQRKCDEKRLREALAEVEQLKNRLELENAYLQEEISSTFNHQQIIGKSPALANIIQQIDLVAPTNATVLVNGESGTGKELIARAIHDSSDRSQRSLIRVNCAAIPADLFESEFFGHIKGAFTGATSDRPGRFELADGGTLFLDEVGEIPLHLQGKLLRVLQEQQFERVGDAKTCNVDVRIIAATNRDLKQLVSDGVFREDLYFRLNVFPIESIPLRQRREDIPLLTQHFLKKACKRANKADLKVSLGELEKLMSYHWPGNIRELENVIDRQVILAQSGTIRFDTLINETIHKQSVEQTNANRILTEEQMRQRDRRNILIALEKAGGKVFGTGGAAELLDIKPTTLMSRIKKFNIDTKQFQHH